MGTTAAAFIYDKDLKRYNGVYINYDGYIEHTGKILWDYWRNFEDVKELCSGKTHIRSLGNSIDDTDYFQDCLNDLKFRNLTEQEMKEVGECYNYYYVFAPLVDKDVYDWFIYDYVKDCYLMLECYMDP